MTSSSRTACPHSSPPTKSSDSSCWTTSASIRRSRTSCSVRTPRSRTRHAARLRVTPRRVRGTQHSARRRVRRARGHATHFAIWQLRDAMSHLGAVARGRAPTRRYCRRARIRSGLADRRPGRRLPGQRARHAGWTPPARLRRRGALPRTVRCRFSRPPLPELLVPRRVRRGTATRAARRAPPRARAHARRVRRATRVALIVWCAWTLARWLEGTRRADFRPIARLASGRERVRGRHRRSPPKQAVHSARGPPGLDRALRAEWGAETDSRPSYPASG